MSHLLFMLISIFYAIFNYRVAQYDLKRLSDLDGLGSWREKEANDLSDLIQRRLHALQHPDECSKARKLICNLNKVSFFLFFGSKIILKFN